MNGKLPWAVAQGMENKEIAEQMNYSYGYIKNVITRIFLKLDIEKRRELRKLLIGLFLLDRKTKSCKIIGVLRKKSEEYTRRNI